jgi:hypothetical protein
LPDNFYEPWAEPDDSDSDSDRTRVSNASSSPGHEGKKRRIIPDYAIGGAFSLVIRAKDDGVERNTEQDAQAAGEMTFNLVHRPLQTVSETEDNASGAESDGEVVVADEANELVVVDEADEEVGEEPDGAGAVTDEEWDVVSASDI